MKNTIIIFFALFISIASCLQAQNLKVKSANISFEFPSKKVKGSIAGFQSTSEIDFNTLETSRFEGSVAAKTLDTNNFLRNLSLRSGRYFNVSDFPRIKFVSNSIQNIDEALLVKGSLTLKGTTKPFEITFERVGYQLIGTASLYSSDYGITIKKERKDNLVKITFDFLLE